MDAKETKCYKWASHTFSIFIVKDAIKIKIDLDLILEARTYQQSKVALAIAMSTEET